MSLATWMAHYEYTNLADLCMPGSHDAGTIKRHIDFAGLGTQSNSVTQDKTFTEQLQCGTRFFDLRLKVRTRGGQRNTVPYHTTARQGALGNTDICEALEEIAYYCRTHRTEVVIVRISHTDRSTNITDIIRSSAGDVLHKGTGNLCKKSLYEIWKFGNLVCIYDKKKFSDLIDQSEGIHGFSKYKGQDNEQGIAVCGCYSATNSLHNVIRNGLSGQYAHNTHDKDGHLWQLYWQKTYTNPWHWTGIEKGTKKVASMKTGYRHRRWNGVRTDWGAKVHGGTHVAASHMIKLMEGHAGYYREDYNVAPKKKHFWNKQNVKMRSTLEARISLLPNIISYDFVNEATNKQIIAINDKGLQDVWEEEED